MTESVWFYFLSVVTTSPGWLSGSLFCMYLDWFVCLSVMSILIVWSYSVSSYTGNLATYDSHMSIIWESYVLFHMRIIKKGIICESYVANHMIYICGSYENHMKGASYVNHMNHIKHFHMKIKIVFCLLFTEIIVPSIIHVPHARLWCELSDHHYPTVLCMLIDNDISKLIQHNFIDFKPS